MASITERKTKDGKICFLVRVSNGTDQDGKRIYLTKTYIPTAKTPTRAKNEAQKFADNWEEDLKSGRIKDGGTTSFKDFVDEWYNNWAVKNLSVSTYKSYKEQLNRYCIPMIGSIALMDIRKAHVSEIFRKMENDNLALGTIKRVKASLDSVFTYAIDGRHLIAENPSEISLKYAVSNAKKTTKTYNVFSSEQYTRFLGYLKDKTIAARSSAPDLPIYYQQQDHLLFSMAIYGGFRRGELLALTWKDIDFNKKTVSINKSLEVVDSELIVKDPKTAAGNRVVDMPGFIMAMLKEWKNAVTRYSFSLGIDMEGNRIWHGSTGKAFDDNFVFVSLTAGHCGNNLDPNTPGHKLRKFLKEYNEDPDNMDQQLPKVCFHDLRHTHVTDLIDKGVQIDKISKRVGHRDIRVTLTVYAHYLNDENDHSIADLFEEAI